MENEGGNTGDGSIRWYYDKKSERYIYQKEFSADDGRIERLSNYTLTVTALCNGEASKVAKLKIKTTDIPASYCDLNDWVYNWDDDYMVNKIHTGCYYTGSRYSQYDATTYGGTAIRVNNGSTTTNLNYITLRSGNTYTLELPLNDYIDNKAARLRKTDTLTWKVVVNKELKDTAGAATVKANAGSYTATLKALKPGNITIEVTSKVTKKVIARYRVNVSAIGDAGAGRYYGETEPK